MYAPCPYTQPPFLGYIDSGVQCVAPHANNEMMSCYNFCRGCDGDLLSFAFC